MTTKKPDRNAPCPCGSGKKYKKCCLAKAEASSAPSQSARAHYNSGMAFLEQGKPDAAISSYRNALALKPDYAEAQVNLGVLLYEQGKLDEAVENLRNALVLRPDMAQAYYNLGNVLHAQGKLDEAIESYRHTIALRPDFAGAYNSLGIVFDAQGMTDAAIKSYRRALALKPDYAEAHSNLGNTLRDQGKLAEATICFRQALRLKSDCADIYYNLGNALHDQSKFAEAVTCFRQALRLNPHHAETYNNLGNTLRDLGELGEAANCYHKALALKPSIIVAYSNLLYLHAFTRDIPPEQERDLAAKWENIALTEGERAAAHKRFSSCADHPSHIGRKLKIGVVSAELGQHSVAEFLEPFLEQIDRKHFHITLYPTTTRTEPRAARFRELADDYKSLVRIPDKKAADLIRSDFIDILIDTTGHMNGCRPGIFAHRAAPVQCHYIGYHGTTGLTEMDWYIADGILLPPAYDAHFREGIWRLPRIRMSYKGNASLPDSNWKPNPDGSILFGSFNNLTKVREESLSLWAKVMNALPQSRLLLKDIKAADPLVRQRITAELFRHGISDDRIEFASWTPDWNSHMALYDRLDIALDTMPLNSETTAFDALWMGVPLVALEGSWVGGRQASTILMALGKPEWVAKNEDGYVAIVTALARDIEKRKSLRANQRALMANSQLCDANGLAKALETAFKEMFQRWLERKNGRPPL